MENTYPKKSYFFYIPETVLSSTNLKVYVLPIHRISSYVLAAAAAAKLLQSCPTLCNPIDGSPLGSFSLGFSRQEYLPFPSQMHVRCSSLSILWHCLSLGLEWKVTFSSPVATAEFSKFAGILSTALSQGGLVCCNSWGRKESDTTEWLNWTELNWVRNSGIWAQVWQVFISRECESGWAFQKGIP